MKTAVSLFVALTLFGLVMGLEACEVVEVAPLTAPLTCDGELVTERFVVSMPGETTTTVTHFCQRAGGERTDITWRVTAVEFLYVWALSFFLVLGMARLGSTGDGAMAEEGEARAPPGGPAETG